VLPADLLKTAAHLAAPHKGKPRQADLLRAASTTYYALFHALARCCADSLLGGQGSARSAPAWRQVYRALDHGAAKDACKRQAIISKFPGAIQDFANMFVMMQAKRHSADYDPDEKVFKSTVLADISAVEVAIGDFENCSLKDKRAFCTLVLFKQRK
jgi:hypothetical protein